MKSFSGETLSWELVEGRVEIELHRTPCNEIGSRTLAELEQFARALEAVTDEAHALIIHSRLKSGFCAGADLRELYHRSQEMRETDRAEGVRDFLKRIHRVMNII